MTKILYDLKLFIFILFIFIFFLFNAVMIPVWKLSFAMTEQYLAPREASRVQLAQELETSLCWACVQVEDVPLNQAGHAHFSMQCLI